MSKASTKGRSAAAALLGSLGGKVKGKCKARSSEACRAAARARWGKVRKAVK